MERVNRNGRRHSPHKHFIKYEQSGLRTGAVYYRLAAFGRTFQFRLEQDVSFVSPALTVEHVYSDTRRLPFAGDLQHCFYRGEIQGDPNSTAVFNLCHGLVSSLLILPFARIFLCVFKLRGAVQNAYRNAVPLFALAAVSFVCNFNST